MTKIVVQESHVQFFCKELGMNDSEFRRYIDWINDLITLAKEVRAFPNIKLKLIYNNKAKNIYKELIFCEKHRIKVINILSFKESYYEPKFLAWEILIENSKNRLWNQLNSSHTYKALYQRVKQAKKKYYV